jgi:co-chaperonin GroES (HSP10)
MEVQLYDAIPVNSVRPLRDFIVVSEMNFAERKTSGGIVIKSDDMKLEGVRPRWAKIYAVGPEQTELKIGEWVLVAHGRWTRGVKIRDQQGNEHVIRRVDNDDILLVSDEIPSDDTFGG